MLVLFERRPGICIKDSYPTTGSALSSCGGSMAAARRMTEEECNLMAAFTKVVHTRTGPGSAGASAPKGGRRSQRRPKTWLFVPGGRDGYVLTHRRTMQVFVETQRDAVEDHAALASAEACASSPGRLLAHCERVVWDGDDAGAGGTTRCSWRCRRPRLVWKQRLRRRRCRPRTGEARQRPRRRQRVRAAAHARRGCRRRRRPAWATRCRRSAASSPRGREQPLC